jgi:hypothetical protein
VDARPASAAAQPQRRRRMDMYAARGGKQGEWRHGGLEGLKMPSHGLVYPKVAGLGHAWVGQILLNCDVFKR